MYKVHFKQRASEDQLSSPQARVQEQLLSARGNITRRSTRLRPACMRLRFQGGRGYPPALPHVLRPVLEVS